MATKLYETAARGAFPESSFQYTPLQHLRWIYCRFVQGLFHAAPRGAYHWENDPHATEIIITGENVINAEHVGIRPAISFTRGPIRFFTLGHDDMLGYDFATGQKKKSVLVPGTISVNCCSRNDLECEQLAWIVAEQLWMNRDLLMKAGFFEVGREPAVGSPSPAGSLVTNDSGEEWYASTVTCPFQFYRTGTVTPLGEHIAESIDVSLRTRMDPVPEQGGYSGYNVNRLQPPAFSLASDAHGGTPDPARDGEPLRVVPHPLNPAQMVVVRHARTSQRGVQPPSIHGRPIPIPSTRVEESTPSVEVTSKFKV